MTAAAAADADAVGILLMMLYAVLYIYRLRMPAARSDTSQGCCHVICQTDITTG